MIPFLKIALSLLLSVVSLISSPVFGNFAQKIEPEDAQNIRLSASIISDIHFDESRKLSPYVLEMGLYDMQKAVRANDALIMLGDVTNHGYEEQYKMLEKTLKKYNPANRLVLVEGNHDTWTMDDHYEEAEKLFTTYNERITGQKSEHAYYSTVINGYSFICLASEYDHVDAYISDEQLRWFDAEMEKASESGLPIFVCCHWPVNQTHGLPDTWGFEKDYPPEKGGLGAQSEQVWNILKKYPNVFYLTGHIHSGFTNEFDAKIYKYHSIETVDSVHLVNLPSYSNMTIRGRISFGTGYQMEVYPDKVLFRARSFSAGAWYTLYDYEIALQPVSR